MNLKELQTSFLKAVYYSNKKSYENILEEVIATPSFDPKSRLAIYHAHVVNNLKYFCNGKYPLLKKTLPSSQYKELLEKYSQVTENTTPFVMEVGDSLADFIEERQQSSQEKVTALIARLDLAIRKATFGEDSQSFDFIKFKQIYGSHPAKIVFHLSKNSTLIDSAYPIHWLVYYPQKKLQVHDLLNYQQETPLIIIRNNYHIHVEPLSKMEFIVLSFFQKGLSLGEILKKHKLLNSIDDTISSLIHRQIIKNRVVDFTVKGLAQEDSND